MCKIFIVSMNRASDGAISKLKQKMIDNNLYTNDYGKADYILACGDRIETFNFVLERFRENKKIIHLWAGEANTDTHDDVYRHSITLMSMMQLCTNSNAHYRVNKLFEAIGERANAYTVGNLMYDNLEIDESEVPKESYDLVLYNPAMTEELVKEDIEAIKNLVRNHIFIWMEPNGDKYSNLILDLKVIIPTMNRPKFLGLLKNCNRFITNSSCQFYEAPYVMSNPKNIIPIGMRNSDRESKYADMSVPNASDNIIKIFKELKNGKI